MKQFIELKPALFNIVFLCLAYRGVSQILPDLKFARLTENDGLSSTSVTSVMQDHDGIIWVGTVNGLNRFDGYGFAKFYASPYDSSSINANEIEAIESGTKDQLWITTGAGICRFSTITQKALQFRSGTNVPAPFRIYDGSNIWFDKGNHLPYIVSPLGLYQFTDASHYSPVDADFPTFGYKKFSFTSYQKIVSDQRGQLWAFRQNRIFRINNQSKKVEEEFVCPNRDVVIYDLIFDSKNRCWVSTWGNGLYTFNALEDSWRHFQWNGYHGVVVKTGVEWKWNDGRFLIFPLSSPALLFIDEETLQPFVYPLIGSIGDINTPFVDRQNILWVPTSNGLYYYHPSNGIFDIIPIITGKSKDGKDIKTNSVVYNMREESGSYWISLRYNGGLLKLTHDWKLDDYWPDLVKGLGDTYDDRLAATKEGFDCRQTGDLLFVTTEWGMMAINVKSRKRKIYRCPWTRNIMRLRTIVPENDHKWWVRSYDQGVFVFDPTTFRFTRHYDVGNRFAGGVMPSANYLIRDHKGRVFETTNAGLYEYDNEKDTFLRVAPKGKLTFGASLMGMAEDSLGILWIGTDNGLVAFDADSGKVVKDFTENNRIGQVQRVTVDSSQNVWFNSIGGYWCWLRKRDRIIQFKYSEGLPYNDGGTFFTASDGAVYAGGNGAVVKFHPARLMDYANAAKTKIVEVLVNDVLQPLPYAASGVKNLEIPAGETNLQVHFDVINYDQPGNNLFYYTLNPGQADWKETENGKLSFINLPPGIYKLSVKGGNKLTGMFTNIDVLSFDIKPHWFQSWEFMAICGIIVAGGVYLMVRRRITAIRKHASLRQKIAETEMMALRSQMNPHFIFNSLNGIEYYILQNEKRNASVYLNKFARLLRIILSNSRQDVVLFADDLQSIRLYIDLELLRFNHNFRYVADIDQALLDGDYRVPPLLIQPFVENAIIHGFAYSDRKDLKLKISAILRGEYVVYTVEDNGVGREKSADLNRLNRPNHASLGLQITRQRIGIFNEQNHGQSSLNIEDLFDDEQKPAGTRVTLKIKSV